MLSQHDQNEDIFMNVLLCCLELRLANKEQTQQFAIHFLMECAVVCND
jgi:hypothetical protein